MICDFICPKGRVSADEGTRQRRIDDADGEGNSSFFDLLGESIDSDKPADSRPVYLALPAEDGEYDDAGQDALPAEESGLLPQAGDTVVSVAVESESVAVAVATADDVAPGGAGMEEGVDPAAVAKMPQTDMTAGAAEVGLTGDRGEGTEQQGDAAHVGSPQRGVLAAETPAGPAAGWVDDHTDGRSGDKPSDDTVVQAEITKPGSDEASDAAHGVPTPVMGGPGARGPAEAGHGVRSRQTTAEGGPGQGTDRLSARGDDGEPGAEASGRRPATEQTLNALVERAVDETAALAPPREARTNAGAPEAEAEKQDIDAAVTVQEVRFATEGQARTPMGDSDGQRNRSSDRAIGMTGRDAHALHARAAGEGDSLSSVAGRAKAQEAAFESVLSRTERFQDFIDRLDGHLLSLVSGRERSMTIGLIPPNLGRLTLNCHEVGRELVIEIVAENRSARALLAEHEGFIRDVVANNGYKLSGFDVRAQGDGAGARQFGGAGNGGSNSGGDRPAGSDRDVGEVVDHVVVRAGPGGVWVVA